MKQDEKIINLIDQKADLSEDIAEAVIKTPKLLDTIMEGVSSSTSRVKFRCAKILKMVSLSQPELLLPHWDFFINLLNSENSIILWNALDIIANLTSVDKEHKFDEVYPRYYQFLEAESMVTAAHVVDNSAKIAANRPDLQNEITIKLLNLNEIPREDECQAILSGKAIRVFDNYFDLINNKDEIIDFAKDQSTSQRNATKVKAQKFLKKHG